MHKNSLNKQFPVIVFPILFFILLTQTSHAQTKVSGRVFEHHTRIPIGGIKIENLRTHTIAVSDTGGRFTIRAVTGDRIVSSGLSYKTDTLYLTNLKGKEIFLDLKQEQMLKEVKIITNPVNLGIVATPITTPAGGNTVRYQTNSSGNFSGGLAIGLPGSNNAEKRRQKEAKLDAKDAEDAKIANVFSIQNLQNYLPIKGQELENYRVLYTPSIKVYHDKFNFPLYVDSCYRQFIKIPAEQRQSKDFLKFNSKP